MEKKRLNKVIAEAGIASRRSADTLIAKGKVRINGQVVIQLGTLVDLKQERIEVDINGRIVPLKIKEKHEFVYYLLNKPAGYITTVKDTHNRRTVLELIPNTKKRIFPVGRLDRDSTGLLLLTNDGELTYKLTHPKFGIIKTYEVIVKGKPSKDSIKLLETGIKLDEKPTAPVKIVSINLSGNGMYLIKIEIHEGRKRQVRNMFSFIGHKVLKLKRIGYGTLTLKGLKGGEYRMLVKEEISSLKKLASKRPSLPV